MGYIKTKVAAAFYLLRSLSLAAILLAATSAYGGIANAFSTVGMVGQIADTQGNPVPDVSIVAANVDTNATYTNVANSDGYYSINVVPGTYSVTFTAASGSGLAPLTQRWVIYDVYASQYFAVQMAPSYNHLSGYVRDDQGSPLSDVEVSIYYEAPNYTQSVRQLTNTTTDGHYDIMAPPHSYNMDFDTLAIRNNPLKIRMFSNSAPNTDVSLTNGSTTQDIAVPLANVTVAAIDASNQPVANFPIYLTSQGVAYTTLWPGGPSFQSSSYATVNTEGSAASPDYGKSTLRILKGLQYETCGGTQENAGLSSTPSNTATRFCLLGSATVNGDSQQSLSTATNTFSGILKDNQGNPVAGTRVFVNPDVTNFGELGVTTGPNGEFSITSQRSPHHLDLASTHHEANFPTGYNIHSDTPVIDLTSTPVSQDLTLGVSAITVRVEDSVGNPLPYTNVSVQSSGRVGTTLLWQNGPTFVGGSFDYGHTNDPNGELTMYAVRGLGYNICADYLGNQYCVPGQPVVSADATYVIRIPEQTPPVVQSLGWSANPLQQGQNTTLSVVASDNTGVAGVTYTIDNGSPQAMTFNASTNTWQATFGSSLAANTYNIAVVATDTSGNQSSPEPDVLAVNNAANGYVIGHAKVLPNSASDLLPIPIDTAANKPAELIVGFTGNKSGTTSADVSYRITNKKDEFSISSKVVKWVVIPDKNHASILATGDLDIYDNGVHSVVQNVTIRLDLEMDAGGQTGRVTMKVWQPGVNPNVGQPTYSITNASLLKSSNVAIQN